KELYALLKVTIRGASGYASARAESEKHKQVADRRNLPNRSTPTSHHWANVVLLGYGSLELSINRLGRDPLCQLPYMPRLVSGMIQGCPGGCRWRKYNP